MIIALAIPAALAYLAVAARVARSLYAHWRAAYLDQAVKDWPRRSLDTSIADFNRYHRSDDAFGALLLAVFWPVTMPTRAAWLWLFAVVTETPARSRAEVEAESAARARRIAQLEAQLGIRDGP